MKVLFTFLAAVFVAPIISGQNDTKRDTVAASKPCVIVKRHVHKFGENMSRFHPHRPFDYVEGDYPLGFKWRSELGDGDVRELQKKGGKIVVLRPEYQEADLEDARKQANNDETKRRRRVTALRTVASKDQ